jgi:hypothetical protein
MNLPSLGREHNPSRQMDKVELRTPNKTSACCIMGVWPNNLDPMSYGA